jgi:hypothetical protein
MLYFSFFPINYRHITHENFFCILLHSHASGTHEL